MNLHSTRVFAAWVEATLIAGQVAAAVGGKPAASSIPAGAGWVAIYPIAGGTVDGSLANPNDDATPDIQCTAVGATPGQALGIADKVRNILLAAVPATLGDGRRVTYGAPSFAEPTLLRDDDVDPPAWYCPDRFSFRTTPG